MDGRGSSEFRDGEQAGRVARFHFVSRKRNIKFSKAITPHFIKFLQYKKSDRAPSFYHHPGSSILTATVQHVRTYFNRDTRPGTVHMLGDFLASRETTAVSTVIILQLGSLVADRGQDLNTHTTPTEHKQTSNIIFLFLTR